MQVVFAFLTILLATALVGFYDDNPEPDFIPGSDHVISGQVVGTFGTCCFVAGASGRFSLSGAGLQNPQPGDSVLARCRLAVREYGVTTHTVDTLHVLGHGAAPTPQNVTLESLSRGDYDLTPVCVRGTIDDVAADEVDPNFRIILLRSGNSVLSIPISEAMAHVLPDIDKLLYAEVEVTGVCCRDMPSTRFFKEPTFLLSGNDPVRVMRPAPADIFNRPPLPSRRLFTPDEIATLGLRSATGTVIAVWGKGNFLLLPPDQGFVKCRRIALCHRIELPFGSATPSVGMHVQVVGQPETDTYRINFSRACWRQLSGSSPPHKPQPCLLKDLVDSQNDRTVYNAYAYGHVVQLTGQLTAQPVTGVSDAHLNMLVDNFDVTVDISTCPDALRELEPGSTLQVAGVCLFEIDNWRENAPRPKIQRMVIVARTADDIVVIKRPPWWTIGRLAVLVCGLLLVLSGVLAWNRILNRIVIRRSRELLREQSARNASELRIGERTRLAVELHDTLSQNLAGVACQVASAQNAIGKDAVASRQRLFTAERMLKSCRTELRQVLSDLRSEALECSTIEEALRSVLEPVMGSAELSIRFNVPRTRLMDSTVHAILCIVRELAGNAIRHGGATKVRVAGALEADRLLFSVQENGAGFDLTTCAGPAQGHFGLDGIRNRISRFGGTFQLETSPGKGSHAVIDIPLPGHEEKETR